MVPVLSGILVGHGHEISTRKAFFLSLTYVLSMAITYAVFGAVISLLGANLQIALQSPWAIGLFSLLFVLLSLSMFGLFDLQLPHAWQSKLTVIHRNQTKGQYISASVMGILSTLILSPCVTAPLIGALSYIAHSGNVVLGSLSLFFLSFGMGTPLLLIGTSAGHWLPKTGHWMTTVKFFFGILLLAIAIYLISRIIPAALSMGLWAILLIFSGIYAGALLPAYSHQDKFKQASGIVLLIYGVFLLTGASMGGSDLLQPLGPWKANHSLSANKSIQSPHLSTTTLTNLADVQSALTKAKAKGKGVMLDFYADWCETCRVLESTVFQDPKVLAALKKVVVLKIDVTANNEDQRTLLRYFNVVAPPTFLFFDTSGEENQALRLVGNLSSADFLRSLEGI
jgi:thiol:disulfide interchange protein DsbD